jgi:hypothetical protein
MKRKSPPRGQSERARKSLKTRRQTRSPHATSTLARRQDPAKPCYSPSRPSWVLDDDFIDLDDVRSIAGAANHAFAKRVNGLRRFVPDDDREMQEFCWRAHDEIFDALDAAFLLTIETTTSAAEALAISAALDKHVDACIERWRVKHIAMLEEKIRAFEEEEEYHRQRRLSHPHEYYDPDEIPPPAKALVQERVVRKPMRRRTMYDVWCEFER